MSYRNAIWVLYIKSFRDSPSGNREMQRQDDSQRRIYTFYSIENEGITGGLLYVSMLLHIRFPLYECIR